MRKLIFVLLLGCAACTTQAQDPGRKTAAPVATAPAAGAPGQGSDTLARIRAAIGDAACTESSQCRSLPIGAVACGGPQGYLPYSTRTDETALRELARRYQAERKAEIAASGMMSTCRHLTDPGAVCSAGTCQLGTSPATPVAR